MTRPSCVVCGYDQWPQARAEDEWCWRCGTFFNGEGNHLGLTAAEALERGTDDKVWFHQMLYGPKAGRPL